MFYHVSAQKSHKTLKSDIQSLFLRQIPHKHQLEVGDSSGGEYLVISLPARHDISPLSNNIKQLTASRSTQQTNIDSISFFLKLRQVLVDKIMEKYVLKKKVFHQDERILYMLIVIDVVNVCINHVMMETISLSIRVK